MRRISCLSRGSVLAASFLGATCSSQISMYLAKVMLRPTGGITSVKGMFTLVGLFQSAVMILCVVVVFKYGKKCWSMPNSGCLEDTQADSCPLFPF